MRNEERNEAVPSAPLWCVSQSWNREPLQNQAQTPQQNVSRKGPRDGAHSVWILRLPIWPKIQTTILWKLQKWLLLQAEQDWNDRCWFYVGKVLSSVQIHLFLDVMRTAKRTSSLRKWTKSSLASAQISAGMDSPLFLGKNISPCWFQSSKFQAHSGQW